jgi:bifunctional DNA-binding transcriptional regulator/antitoxin component of YhaV-PrlF toxin-antitoxin module
MTISVKNDNKTPLVVPPAVRRRARFKSGQELEFRASGGVISIIPKLPDANDEYTSAQRRLIDAELREAEKGPFYGPFDTVDEMIVDLKGRLAKPKRRKKTKTSRSGRRFSNRSDSLKGTSATPPSMPRSTTRQAAFGKRG